MITKNLRLNPTKMIPIPEVVGLNKDFPLESRGNY